MEAVKAVCKGTWEYTAHGGEGRRETDVIAVESVRKVIEPKFLSC